MISGQDLLVGKRALQIGLLHPTLLNDVLALQQVSTNYRSLTEILDEQKWLDTEAVKRVRNLRTTMEQPGSNASVRLADYRNLLFGTTAVIHGFCSEQELQRALEVLDEADATTPVTLGHVMVALNMLKPEDVEQVRSLQRSEVAYCPRCDTIYSTAAASGARDAVSNSSPCPVCGDTLVRDEAHSILPSGRRPRVEPTHSGNSGEVTAFSDDAFTVPGELVEVREAEIVEEGPPDAHPVAPERTQRPNEPSGTTGTTSFRTSAQALGEHDLEDAVRAAGQSEYLRRITKRYSFGRSEGAPIQDAGEAPPQPPLIETDEPLVAGPFDDLVRKLESSATVQGRSQRETPGSAPSETIHWRRPTGSPSESTLRVVEVDGPRSTTPQSERRDERQLRSRAKRQADEDSSAGAGASIGVQIGEYVVLSELGRGGMGVVYLARKLDETRPRFAIKFIRKDLSRNATYVRRFEREIKLVLSLNHANIVATHEYGQRDGYWYLVMEYVRGENLGDILERENRLSVNRAVSVVRQTALALASAHEQGIVHRDMKPDNIILSPASAEVSDLPHAPPGHPETVKVTDFGLAKEMAGLDDTLTITGQLIGTPHYMSPEQCRGDYSDQRSDIYSLGCAFYHMLTGRPPFLGDNYLSVMEQQKSEPITPPHVINPSVPLSLSFIIGKMMEKNANDRYPTMELLVSHLDMWDSTKLVDEVARYAPAFSRVRSAFGRSEEFTGSVVGERMEKEWRKARDHAEWLRQRIARLERRLQRSRNLQMVLVTGGVLATLLGLALGYALGSGGFF